MTPAVGAIVWAQWRTLLNVRRGARLSSAALAAAVLSLWFGAWLFGAVALALACAKPSAAGALQTGLPAAFLLLCGLWQLTPVMISSQGSSLDVKRLLAYPVAARQLYPMDLILRLTSNPELLLLLTGATIGITVNPALTGKMAPAGAALLVVFNLCAASGLRQQIERLASRRRLREAVALLFLIAVALPQLVLAAGGAGRFAEWIAVLTASWWPWSAAARLAVGDLAPGHWAILLGWTGAAWMFGRWQFERSLTSESGGEPRAEATSSQRAGRLVERWVSSLLPDPLAALTVKELLTLARTPRFRLVFFMGFTFGVLIFVPMMLRQEGLGAAAWAEYRLTMVAVYALLLLGDAVFWNIFGFDRAAAQIYFTAPQGFGWVLAGKNLAAMAFVLLEVSGVALVWMLIGMPVGFQQVVETYAVTMVFCLYLMGTGNLVSLYYPRAASPDRSMGATSAFSVRILLLLAYPALAAPVLLAYAARYAFQSRLAFYLSLGFAAALGAFYYAFALGSASERAHRRREQFLEALRQGSGPATMG